MTGWRVGWMVVPPRLVRTMERLAQNLYISPPAVAQVAALGAFDGIEELEANRRVYAANRELLAGASCRRLACAKIVPADGAFYLYADVGDYTRRQPGVRQGHAGGDRRRGDAGRRFRCGARPALHALLLLRHDRRYGRGGAERLQGWGRLKG